MFYDRGARKLFLHGIGHACKHGWVMLRWEVAQPQIGSNVPLDIVIRMKILKPKDFGMIRITFNFVEL